MRSPRRRMWEQEEQGAQHHAWKDSNIHSLSRGTTCSRNGDVAAIEVRKPVECTDADSQMESV